MVHVNIVIVHHFEDEFILLRWFSNFADAVAVTVFLDLDSIHLHLQSIMNVSNIIPCALNSRGVHKVKLFMHIESTVVDPVMIVSIIS